MKLSILICTVPQRADFLQRLYNILIPQKVDEVEILVSESVNISIGEKRNALLESAKGDYIAFIDDDDRISDNYISLILKGIDKGVDCCSLRGIITEDGRNPQIFEHSIRYKEYSTDEAREVVHERFPNHLNAIKSSIAKQFKFPHIDVSEDTNWAYQIFHSGLIKTEHYIPQVIYYYEYRRNKKEMK